MENWIPVSSTGMTKKEYWNDSSPTSYRDSFAVSQPLTVLPRHTVTVSLDPANKQRDDDCRLAINI
ncbi:hypothetical protein NMD99_06090 [Wolbachia endosymbiont of Listronotus oregonensis]|uniref:hypothetical protein n=1 Tax=Wolbachia endosymbiont of Listronotus oregonensis TaxID=2969106 RepID=UPI002814D2B3|nr:hypothetical protein [Wolbachia endosymbiont of Listronotus oregonensis]WMT84186.1 hypothetical protein NMD99_06090 [Wolbachia endosymbiont of Listronotus oregonensis]